MRTATAWSVAMIGLKGSLVEIEVAHGGGTPRTVMVGLPDTSLYEARDRVKAAVSSVGFGWPQQLLTINLTPATLPKKGSHYDLGIAAAILAVLERVPQESLAGTALMGELGLDGRVRPVNGILPGMLSANENGLTKAIVPKSQVAEARLVEGIQVWGVSCLTELVEILQYWPDQPLSNEIEPDTVKSQPKDMVDVLGQPDAKWAFEIAAAGRHHIFVYGAPGVGKTMLAERLPTILPDLNPTESVEVSAIHSLAGITLKNGLIKRPPYTDPHHTISMAGLIGGGGKIIRPGSISLAHRGVLFIDEAPEFSAKLLDSLRTPMESGWVTIERVAVHAKYPARFQLVAAANPCPCGMAGMPGGKCNCGLFKIRRYRERISGPILDRIDIQQRLVPIRKAFLKQQLVQSETSAKIAQRVSAARERQAKRLMRFGWVTNGEVSGSCLRRDLAPADGKELIDDAVINGKLTSRGVDKILRIAWTLADLSGKDQVHADQIKIAMAMRLGQKW